MWSGRAGQCSHPAGSEPPPHAPPGPAPGLPLGSARAEPQGRLGAAGGACRLATSASWSSGCAPGPQGESGPGLAENYGGEAFSARRVAESLGARLLLSLPASPSPPGAHLGFRREEAEEKGRGWKDLKNFRCP